MFRAAPIAASMAVEETGNDRRASRRDRNEMEDGGTGLPCFARNDGAAGRGRKFRPAVATSRARRSRLPVRHAKSRPRWASSVRDDGKRNRRGHGEHAHRHLLQAPYRQIDLVTTQGSPSVESGSPALLASHQHVSGVRTRDRIKENGNQSERGIPLTSCAPVAGALLWHRLLWAGRCSRCSVVPGHRTEL
jgi:hypothetical protein